jgi:ADP-ribosyl-[dinitrogen reductase] hydrolase
MGGYGSLYRQWVFSEQHAPYGSWGNGAAMRVSPVAWYYSSLQQVLTAARDTALPTHDHPEGIKGAQAVAHAIYVLRTRNRPSEDWSHVLAEVATHYYPDAKSRKFTRGYFDGSCMGDVPLAFRLVLASSNFEDAIRRAISWGGDSDTIGAIVGSMAEAIWQSPSEMEQKALTYLPAPIKQVVRDFDKRLQAL